MAAVIMIAFIVDIFLLLISPFSNSDQEAEIHQQRGRRRLKEAQSGQKAVKQMAEDIREARLQHHASRVLQLKA
eukprot:s7251_g3.t1